MLGVAFGDLRHRGAAPKGNGFIAVFVCAITLGIRRPDIGILRAAGPGHVEIVKLGIFVVFGSLLTLDGLFADGWAAVGIVAFTLLWPGRSRSACRCSARASTRPPRRSWPGSGPRAWRR